MESKTLQPIDEVLHRRMEVMASHLGLNLTEAVDLALKMWLEVEEGKLRERAKEKEKIWLQVQEEREKKKREKDHMNGYIEREGLAGESSCPRPDLFEKDKIIKHVKRLKEYLHPFPFVPSDAIIGVGYL